MARVQSSARHVSLEGAFNFRDLGGYPAADGRVVRWRQLFRADSLGGLTPSDLDALKAMGLRTVVDLRTVAEVDERGRLSEEAGLAYHHLPLIDVLPPADSLERWAEPAYVADQYAEMLASGTSTIKAALDLIADATTHPIAYHCMAGKDRTGILSALVLGLLGVADDDIVADYALSGEGMERKLAWLRQQHPELAGDIDASAAVVASEPESMELFLAHLTDTHGGVHGYVEAIGLGGLGDRLRAELLEEPRPTI